MSFSRTIAAGIAVAVAAVSGAALADPIEFRSGAALLPMSALVIDLPANPSLTYKVSGSWSLDDSFPSFDARDVIDEYDSTGAIVAGSWVLTGYFTAGGCTDVLSGENLDKAWTTDTTLWGQSWKVRGGVYTFTGDIGRRPAAMLCRTDGLGRSLVLYRFLVDKPETLPQADIMKGVVQSGVLQSASKSYDSGRTASVLPVRRPEVRNRGETLATRAVKLPKSGLTVTFPDDGYVWLVTAGDNSDMINLMAPSLPDVTLEFTAYAGMTCADFTGQIGDDRPDIKPVNTPQGWLTGPSLTGDGTVEMTLCKASGDGIRLVGLFLPSGQTDVAALNPVIDALGNAQ